MRGRRILGIAILIAWWGGPALAESRGDGDRPYWRTNLFKRVATDQKFLVTRWWPREIRDPAFGSALAAGVILAVESGGRDDGGHDLRWEVGIESSSNAGVKGISRGFTKLGNGTTLLALLGITYLSSRHAENSRLAEASSLATESLFDAGIWVMALKFATARVRPYGTGASRFFDYDNQAGGSFPSGHSMGAFAVAAAFAGTYADKRWVPWVSYGLATLISASRLTLGRHFPGDVVVGGVLGASIGRGVVARCREESPRVYGTFLPVVGPDGHGVGVGWRYTWK